MKKEEIKKNGNDDLREIHSQIGRLSRLMALLVFTMGEKHSFQDKIELLDRAGFEPNEITELVGKPLNFVTATLSNIKKKKDKTKDDN